MNKIIINHQAKPKLKLSTSGVLTLLAFLFALFVHQEHVTEKIGLIDKPDCYVCQQGCDTPPKILNCEQVKSTLFIIKPHQDIEQGVYKKSYTTPQLRAPPFLTYTQIT
jgi:hypothetical protein